MHLVIDCRCVHSHMGGIGQAAKNLAVEMAKNRREHRITVLVGQEPPDDFQVPGAGLQTVPGAMIDERFEQLHLPPLLKRIKADLYLNPTFSVPIVKTTRHQIAIVHDVVFEEHPEWVEPRLRTYLQRWSRFSAQEADRVITVSDYSLERIREIYGVPEERIRRIYNGVPERFFEHCQPREIERVSEKYSLSTPYILYLGSIEPKKGIAELLEGYSRLARAGSVETLVLAGSRGSHPMDLESALGRLGIRDRVRFLGYVDESDKKPLLAGARLFVYPSLYEGFGIPPLEAMALGVPCLVHRGTSLPEVVGEVGLAVDVRKPDQLALAFRTGLDDDQFRQKARDEGPRHARGFSWAQAARQVLDLSEELEAA
jgi:glycosyltransferase involved in cell wall biosynthesis